MTAQKHECLIINGEEASMAFCPPIPLGNLNISAGLVVAAIVGAGLWGCSSFSSGLAGAAIALPSAAFLLRQKRHPRIIKMDRGEDGKGLVYSTACWRGYIGTWEIRDDHFYLVNLSGKLRLRGDEPLLADWFSGTIRVPRGEILEYVHMGFGSVFEEELHVKIEKGKVVASRIVDNRGKKHDGMKLGWRNLPGRENRFDGDRKL